jgi:hypothetical protein
MFIFVDGVFICLFFHIQIPVIFINLNNKLALIINMRSKEINLYNKIFLNNTRYVVMNYSNRISMTIYRSNIQDIDRTHIDKPILNEKVAPTHILRRVFFMFN